MAALEYVPVGPLDALRPGHRQVAVVGRHAVLVVNVDGQLYAVPNACPHREWPLAEANLCGDVLRCARHAWEFDVPSGRAVYPPFGYRLRHLPVRVEEGIVHVAWTEPEVEPAH